MYLHLGGTMAIDANKVIFIQNLEQVRLPEDEFKLRPGKKKVLDISAGKPKSAVYTDQQIIISPISSLTLNKRVNRSFK